MNAVTTGRDVAVQQHRSSVLMPTTLDEAVRFADRLAKAEMIPKEYSGRPNNVLVAILWGWEVGLGPLQALNSISVINGKPAMWGDAMLAMVRASPLCLYVRETITGEGDAMVATCRTRRRGDEEEIVAQFSTEDAKKAGLWSKSGTWAQYPKRMLQLRARGFALRDGFPDVLRGVISREEAQDIIIDGTYTEEPETKTKEEPKSRRDQINADVPIPPPSPSPDHGPTNLWAREKLALVGKHKHLTDRWITAVADACPQATSSEDLEAFVDEIRQQLSSSSSKEANTRIGAAVMAARKRLADQPKPELAPEARIPFPGDELVDGVPVAAEAETVS